MGLGDLGTYSVCHVKAHDSLRFQAMGTYSLNLETSQIASVDNYRSSSMEPAFLGCTIDADRAFTHQIWPTSTVVALNMGSFGIEMSFLQTGLQTGCLSCPNTQIYLMFDAVQNNVAQAIFGASGNDFTWLTFLAYACLWPLGVHHSDRSQQ
jgi:hypothetical protein